MKCRHALLALGVFGQGKMESLRREQPLQPTGRHFAAEAGPLQRNTFRISMIDGKISKIKLDLVRLSRLVKSVVRVLLEQNQEETKK